MVRRDAVDELAIIAEAVEMAVADRSPVDEFDAELEATLRRTDELALLDAEDSVEDLHQWHCRFANADGADFLGFDQTDLRLALWKQSRERRRGHPAGGSPADDEDVADAAVGHAPILLSPRGAGKRKER